MKGKFNPINPSKYKGNPSNIIWRSHWELDYMSKLDKDPDVLTWSSEENIISYRSPLDDKMHRYFPDFVVTRKVGNTAITEMIEVKPYKQTIPPKIKSDVTRKQSRAYLKESMVFMVNMAKWKAAKKYCEDRGWIFKVLSEKEMTTWDMNGKRTKAKKDI